MTANQSLPDPALPSTPRRSTRPRTGANNPPTAPSAMVQQAVSTSSTERGPMSTVHQRNPIPASGAPATTATVSVTASPGSPPVGIPMTPAAIGATTASVPVTASPGCGGVTAVPLSPPVAISATAAAMRTTFIPPSSTPATTATVPVTATPVSPPVAIPAPSTIPITALPVSADAPTAIPTSIPPSGAAATTPTVPVTAAPTTPTDDSLSADNGSTVTPPPPAHARFTDDTAFSAAFAASGSAAMKLASKLSDVRAVAATRDFYLAQGPDVVKRVSWIRDGNAHMMLDKTAGFATMEARAAHAAQPLLNPSPACPDLAPFYVIGNIGTERCFLHSDGNYNAPMQNATFKRTLLGTTLACALVPPPDDYPFLVDDYNKAMVTISSLIHLKVKTPWDGVQFTQLTQQHVRIRHKVFHPKNAGDPGTGHLPHDYQTETWPVCDEAQLERQLLVKTHFAHPLPAFDVNGDLISPSNYLELSGATVLAGISLTHFPIPGKNVVCLDIEYLRVLIPGSRRSSGKRGAVQMTDPLSHAAQKRRAL
ncbi:hypothetical protein LXA43DRAFT_1068897 [Ganoderma leucocontextum]|nr:hypothetical protein LXA43DRAFT_1068897 [Ganoderma leucocontextum]